MLIQSELKAAKETGSKLKYHVLLTMSKEEEEEMSLTKHEKHLVQK